MQRLVSLREMNQHFGSYIEDVEKGIEIIVTRRGKPVAKMISLKNGSLLTPQQKDASERLNALMEKGLSLKKETFNRDTLHVR